MRIERDGEVAIIRLQAGRANAMDPTFLRGLIGLFDQVESADVRAAVLTGYDTYFSAGLALPSLIALGREELSSFMELFDTAMRKVFSSPLPVVAAINGHAIAGGCVLALQCDVRLMADGPLKIGLNEVQLGIGLPSVVIEPMRLQLLPPTVTAIALGGLLYSPWEAQQLGLVDAVLPPGELLSKAVLRARALTSGTREAVAQIKTALRKPTLDRIESDSARDRERWINAWFSSSTQERIAATVARLSAKR